MLNFSYLCLYDLLSTIPSLTDPTKTVVHEIYEFNALPGNKTYARARLVAKGATGPEIVDVKRMGLTNRDRHDLVHMTMEAHLCPDVRSLLLPMSKIMLVAALRPVTSETMIPSRVPLPVGRSDRLAGQRPW